MYKEISNKKTGAQDVKYLHDPSLPEGWRCQLVMSCLYFFSPLGERLVIVVLLLILKGNNYLATPLCIAAVTGVLYTIHRSVA